MSDHKEIQAYGLLLAAGASRRMGALNKLTVPVDERALLMHGLSALQRVVPVHLVTGYQADEITAQVDTSKVTVVHNPTWEEGIASSIRAGVSSLPPGASGVMIMPADMPWSSGADFQAIADLHKHHPDDIIVPYADERQGNPVLWPRSLFHELLKLEGDRGAKGLLSAYPGRITAYKVTAARAFDDIDTPADLHRVTR